MPGRWRRPGRMYLWLVGLAPAAAHLYVGSDRAVSGPALVLDHMFVVMLVGAMLALCAALGSAVLRRMAMPLDSDVETIALAIALGSGLLATLVLCVGALGQWGGGFKPVTLALMGLAIALLLRKELAALTGTVSRAGRELRDAAGTPILVMLGILFAAMTVQALAPPTDYDSLMYHLQVPAEFLRRGAIHAPDTNPLHLAVVGLLHLLYVPLLAFKAPAGPALLNVAFAAALGAVVLVFARRFFSLRAGRAALLVLWGSPILVLVAITPKVDVTLVYFLTLGHFALLAARESPERTGRWLALAGGILGFAAGIKYLALPYVVALSPLVLAIAVGRDAKLPGRARLLAVFAAAFLAAMLPWLAKNQTLLGAPLYPYFAERVPAPWLTEVWGSPDFPAGIDSASVRPLRAVRAPFNIADWFLAPDRLTPESEAAHYRANPFFVLALFAIPLLRNGVIAWVAVPAVLYVGIVLAMGTSINLRYLMPVAPPLTLLASVVLAAVAARVPGARARAALLAFVGAVALVGPATALGARLARTRAPAHVVGLTSRREYGIWSRDQEIRSYANLTAQVDLEVPAPGRVLLLFEGRGYGFGSRVLQDNVLTNWVYLEPALRGARCLESAGITHVLVGTGTLEYFEKRGLDPSLMHWDRFDDFAARCLELVTRRPAWDLYRVKAP